MTNMLIGFALYKETYMPDQIIGVPIGTRLMRIERIYNGWRVWTATNDFKYGSYLELFNNGEILSFTTRVDEGDECFTVKPPDGEH